MRRLTLFLLLAAMAPARADTVLWPKAMHLYTVEVPAGWKTEEFDNGVNLAFYPPDKSCVIVVSYLKNPDEAGRSTDDIANDLAARSGLTQFAAAGAGAISGVKGNAYTGTLKNPADGATWTVRAILVQLRPTVWAIELVKWRPDTTADQQAACNKAGVGVTLNYH